MTDDAAAGVIYLTMRQDWASRRRLRPVKVTGTAPRVLDAGDVVIKLIVRIPLSAFAALDGGVIEVTPDETGALITKAPAPPVVAFGGTS